MTKILEVNLGERSYPIFIGANLIGNKQHYIPYLSGSSAMIVTNESVAPLYLNSVKSALEEVNVDSIVLPDGEEFKTLEIANRLFTRLLEKRFDRRTTVVALGGGVVGDIAGFSAACYQRGIDFIQVPTTLLAQVDSSVGGKTGVNHALGKNMIGAFHQPKCVIADTNTLRTLDSRQLSAGLAEVIKYGLIGDYEFFVWLENNVDRLMYLEESALVYAIEASCRSKALIVEADERESGKRALLNLGHTFGHAIETAMGYGNWLHGEAVAAGTCMAALMSEKMGWLARDDVERIIELYRRADLPTRPPAEIPLQRFLSLMAVDKKVMDGDLRLVLLKHIGDAVVTREFDQNALEATIQKR